MRHIYFRLLVGIVWIIVGVVNLLAGQMPFGILYIIVGAVFLHSSWTLYQNKKGE